jgi:Caspase domain
MPEVVQARCPHCKNVLHIPVQWMHQPMRCKHCRQIFQARQKPATPQAAPGKPSPAVSSRTPVPPQAPRAIPVGNIPVAGQQPLFNVTNARGTVPSVRQPPRPRSQGSGLWKGPLLAASVLVTATVLVVVFWDHISNLAGQPSDRVAVLVKPAYTSRDTGDPGKSTEPIKATARAFPATVVTAREPVVPAPEPPKKVEPPKVEPPKVEPAKKVEPPKVEPPKVEPPKVEPPKVEPPKTEATKVEPPKKVEVVKVVPPKRPSLTGNELFPRRALAIGVSGYLLANPLHYGTPRDKNFPGSSVRAALTEFGNFAMKFPNTQLFELSDGARDPHPPVKSVIETTITDFLTSARAQDRLVLLFAGHAITIDKEAYLVPIDAAIKDADPKTLIPLSWVYDRLKECKARQKVLILDVCRYDPVRGEERPGGGPLDETLDARLQQPPAGVQVWSSCVKEQRAYEFERGSVFLQALCAAMQEPLPSIADPNDALPLDVLVPRVNKYLETALKIHKLTQTSRLVGDEAKNGAPFDPSQPLATLVVIKPPAQPPGGIAGPAVVQSILDELKLVPPVRSARDATNELTAAAMPPFPAKALEPYQADYMSVAEIEKNPGKYPLRVAVLKAAQVLRENANKFRMKEFLPGTTTAQVKKQALAEQANPGKSILALEEALDELKKAGEDRDKETSKRWQANYDYVVARLESRLVYVCEYNYLLAQIRTDSLPPLENGATGYRLGAKKKVGIPESKVKDWVKEIDRTWKRMAQEYANTPWAVVANRERMTVLGLEWRPTRQ